MHSNLRSGMRYAIPAKAINEMLQEYQREVPHHSSISNAHKFADKKEQTNSHARLMKRKRQTKILSCFLQLDKSSVKLLVLTENGGKGANQFISLTAWPSQS